MKYFKIVIVGLMILSFRQGFGPCGGKSKGTRGYNSVKYFITLKFYEDKRTETGATNEPESSIKVVENSETCTRIEQILDNDSEIDNSTLHSDLGKYFYETTNYYYAFWSFHPRFDGLPKTGPKFRFIVIKKDFSQNWKYYL
jgi:hypothetical protein